MTDTTERVYTAIKDHFDRMHYPPTRRELAIVTGLSPTTVGAHLDKLVDQGRLLYEPRKHRGIQLTNGEK